MEVAKLIVEIAILIVIFLVGAALIGFIAYHVRMLKKVAELLEVFNDDQHVHTFANGSTRIAESVDTLSRVVPEHLKGVEVVQQGVARVAAQVIISIRALTAAVKEFQKSLLDVANRTAGKVKDYDVASDITGETQEQREEREMQEILSAVKREAEADEKPRPKEVPLKRVYDTQVPDMIETKAP